MAITKLIILLSYICHSLASEPSHIIPIEHYETELQNLGQHVEIPETPVKVIKITKTVAVKIPVPYPVKVIEKVPYPVHVAKPYPVPVPQIVHVPQPAHPPAKPQHEHQPLDVQHDGFLNLQHHPSQHENSEGQYQVQETPSHESSFGPYNGNSDHSRSFGISNDGSSSYELPNSHYGYSGNNDDNGSYESKRYEQTLRKHHPNSGHGFKHNKNIA